MSKPRVGGSIEELLERSGRFFTPVRSPATCVRSPAREAARVMCSTATGGVTTRWCAPHTG